jgi:hypothetical protein
LDLDPSATWIQFGLQFSLLSTAHNFAVCVGIYSLLLGQCTQVLVDKMKRDADWQAASDSYDPLKLLKLIEKSILKQSDNQYKIGIIIEQLKLLLNYWQDDGVTNAVYYNQFKTRMDVVEHIGVSFDNSTLWDWKS